MKIIRPIKVLDTGSFARNSVGAYWNEVGNLIYAPVNTPRFSYDPTDLKKLPTLLIEKAASNLIRYSEQFNNGVWAKTGTIVADSIIAPDAGSADKLVESSLNAECKISQYRTGAAETLTFSVMAKPAGRNLISLTMTNSSTYSSNAVFDLVNGSVTSVSLANADYINPSANISKYPNGWYRCEFTVTKRNENNVNTPVINILGPNGELSYQGNGTSACYLWAAQLEAGTQATSYMPSTASASSRDADVNTRSMSSTLSELDAPPYDATKTYMLGDRVIIATEHRIYESAVGKSAYVTFWSPNGDVTWAGHSLTPGQPVRFKTDGTLPAAINATTTYYVYSVIDASRFTIALSVGASGPVYPSGDSTGNHQCLTADNFNKSPSANPSVWLDAGPTNAWAMFDQSVDSQTVAQNAISISLKLPASSLADCVVIQNITGASQARVVMTDPVDGVVYDQTISLISTGGIRDLARWFFEPIRYLESVIFHGLPRYSGATVAITLGNTGRQIGCGLCVVGLSKYFGPTQAGTQLSIQDYSVKETDEFGNTRVLERPYIKSMNLTVWVDSSEMDVLLDMLNSYRATPIVYIGDDVNSSSVLYGFFKDYTNGIDMPTVSVLHIEIESLK